MGVRAKIIELFNRKLKVVGKENIKTNGSDNLYPERIERVINNSVTAKSASEKLHSFLLGEGFKVGNEEILNTVKNLTKYDILDMVCKDASKQKGAWIHVNYDFEGNPNYYDVIPYKKIRRSETDDLGYGGLLYYSDDWGSEEDSSFSFGSDKQKTKKYFYPYNSKVSVINEQRKRDIEGKEFLTEQKRLEALVKNYRGQLFFVNLEPNTIYPLSFVDVVYNDADTEYRIGLFKNNKIRTGFVEATIIAVREDEEIGDEDIKTLLGAENSSNVLKIVPESLDNSTKLEDAFHIETVSSNIDKDLFVNWEETIKHNIRSSFCEIPKILVESSDGSFFGANSEAMDKAHDFYNNNTLKHRKTIVNQLSIVFNKPDLEIIPLKNGKSDVL